MLVTLHRILDISRIKESPNDYPNDMKMISNLLSDHEQIIKILRKNADDAKNNI